MKKNVASQVIGVQMVSATDGSAFTGTATVVVTVDGGTQSASGGTGPTHEGNGYHTYIPTQAETNGDIIGFTFTGSGAIPTTVQVFTTFPQTADAPTAAAIRTEMDSNSTQLAAIVADTNELQTDNVPGLIATAQADLDLLTGTDGATLATSQPNYAPATAAQGTAIEADTQDIQSRIPAALVGGRIDATIDATGFEDAAVDKVWDELTAGHVTASTFGKAIADILADTNELQSDDVPGLLAALNDISVADITGATVTELSAVPAASPTLIQALGLLYMALRNKLDVTASAKEIHNDAGTVLGTKSLSDDGTTYSEGKMS